MTRNSEETTYEELFERHLTKIVRFFMIVRFGDPGSGREGLFEHFLETNVFICSSCRGEFTAVGTKETDVVRCDDCRS